MRDLFLLLTLCSLAACGDSGTGGGGNGTGGDTPGGNGTGGDTPGGNGSGGDAPGGSGSGGNGTGGDVSGGGGAGGGGVGSGTITWTADGANVTTAAFNDLVDKVTIPAAGFASLSLVAQTADAMEQMSYVFFFAGGETIPAGTYTCGAFPNVSDSATVTLAHLGVVGQATDNAASETGECSLTLDVPATQGSLVTGSFTITAPQAGSSGPDIQITNGDFAFQDN